MCPHPMGPMSSSCSGKRKVLYFGNRKITPAFLRDAIEEAVKYKANPIDIEDQILEELDNFDFNPETNDE